MQSNCKHSTRKDYRHNNTKPAEQGRERRKSESIRPSKCTKFCPDCGRSKMVFKTEKEALDFMRYNSQMIEEMNGFAPKRAYYCLACGGWHLTHRERWNSKKLTPVEKLLAEVFMVDPEMEEVNCRSRIAELKERVSGLSAEAVRVQMELKDAKLALENERRNQHESSLKLLEERLLKVEQAGMQHRSKLSRSLDVVRKILAKVERYEVPDYLSSRKQALHECATRLHDSMSERMSLLYLESNLKTCRRCMKRHDEKGAYAAWKKAFSSIDRMVASPSSLDNGLKLRMLDELETLCQNLTKSSAV